MSTPGTTIVTAPATAPITPPEPMNPLGEFKSVEELAAAYQALVAKSAVPPEAPPVVPADASAAAAGSETPKDTTEGGDGAAAALEQRGLNIQEFSAEFAEKGELSPESYDKLAKNGIPKEIVDSYIEGQKLRGAAQSSALLNELSTDRSTFDAARQWAASNLSPEQLQVYNGLVAKGGLEARMAVNDLLIQYGKANPASPADPTRITGQRPAAQVTGYTSIREMSVDQANPKYKTDPAFRAQVEARARASTF
jgi:hypothetical protein